MLLTPAQISDFHRDGYVIVPALYSAAETAAILAQAQNDRASAQTMPDAEGRATKLSIWTAARHDALRCSCPFGPNRAPC